MHKVITMEYKDISKKDRELIDATPDAYEHF